MSGGGDGRTTAALASPVVGDGAGGPLDGRALAVCDTTLRDGSHSVAHQFTEDDVRAVTRRLDAAGVPVVEVTHGDGRGGSFAYGFSHTDEVKLLRVAREELSRAKLAALLLPGIGTVEHPKEAVDTGIDVVRVATHCTEADIAVQHLGAAKELGLETVGLPCCRTWCPPRGWPRRRASCATRAPTRCTSWTPPVRCCPTRWPPGCGRSAPNSATAYRSDIRLFPGERAAE